MKHQGMSLQYTCHTNIRLTARASIFHLVDPSCISLATSSSSRRILPEGTLDMLF